MTDLYNTTEMMSTTVEVYHGSTESTNKETHIAYPLHAASPYIDSLRKLAWPKLVGVDVDGILDCRGEDALDLPRPEDG